MKIFWLNDGLHITAEREEERLALEILLQAIKDGNLIPEPEPMTGPVSGAVERVRGEADVKAD